MPDVEGHVGPAAPRAPLPNRSLVCRRASASRGVSTGPRAAAVCTVAAGRDQRRRVLPCQPVASLQLRACVKSLQPATELPGAAPPRAERTPAQLPRSWLFGWASVPLSRARDFGAGGPSGSVACNRQVPAHTGAGLSRREQRPDDYPPAHRQHQPGSPSTPPSHPLNRAGWSSWPRPRSMRRAEINGGSCLCTRQQEPQM